MAEEKPTSWWATLPGLLTAAAAVITAVTGLLLGLGQLGVFDAGRPAASTAGASASGPARPGGVVPPSVTASGTGNSAEWAVALPAGRNYRAADVEYEILDARARPDVSGKVALTFTLRCTNHGRYDINFWDAAFRLNVGGVSHSPDSGLNEVVAGDSSTSGEVRFTIPADTRTAVLRIKFAQGESTVQVGMSPI
ncbi:hypothetical protein TV39_11995 [Arthrobacter sp. SPG23]|uniref:hypothetical protein n=1 Tax=Arthrobacter sp. SPG23 TaxID=1610703 RepID=UPI0005BD806C|nr:hypothetical protein [Arthrobacter sp. SPG23]KIS27240.1 hypothetical protein TV39_11995 [Arthrobacter sp. SPG23]